MKTEIFEMKSSKWQKLSEKEILHKDWSNYHFINLFNEDCISLKGIGVYMKSEPIESLDEIFDSSFWKDNFEN
tara:strand:+ start:328 stop:546 length:219 start_codon:yes stop_codon:yes gene_type:complete